MKHLNNKLKRTTGRLFLLTMGLFLLTASRGVAQFCPALGSQYDLESVSIFTTAFPSIGIGQATTVNVTLGNNGPCPIPIGEANAQVTLSSVYFDLVGPTATFVSTCGIWTLLGITTSGGLGGQHNLFFRNNGAPVPVGGAFCGFTFVIRGANVTPPGLPGDISLVSGLNALTTTGFDANILNQFANSKLAVTAFIVPVILSDFSGVANSCNGVLSWKTVTEDNVDRFEIEYSASGANFTKVGTVDAKNTSDGAQYRFVNAQGTGRGNYRLKIIDNDCLLYTSPSPRD